MKKVIVRIILLGIVGAGGWAGYKYYKQLPSHLDTIPTTKVQKSDVVIRAFSRGELHAIRVMALLAPNLNGTTQVTQLAPVGALAHEKDLIVEYDDSERQAALEEARLEVQSVDENIKKARTDMAIQDSQDKVTLLKTGYDVRRAELEVKKNDIIDAIDAKKNVLQLDQSKRALVQLNADILARKEQTDSQIAVLNEQRQRANLQVQQELQRLANTRTLAPITGLVSIKQNRAGFLNFGQQLPEIREGDTLQPGMPVSEILDLSELEVWTKVGELDRANLREGQEALLQLDAIPDKRFNGKIKAMSGTAAADVYSGDPSKKFDVIFSIDMRQLLGGLGMKQTDIDRIMATAAENAKKAAGNNSAANFFSGLQGGDGGRGGVQGRGGDAGPGGAQGRGGAEEARGNGQRNGRGGDAQGGGRGQGRGARGAAVIMSAEDRAKMNELLKQTQGATNEDRKKLMAQVQELMQKSGLDVVAGRDGRGGGGRRAGGGGRRAAGGDAAAGDAGGGFAGGGRRGGGAGGPGGGPDFGFGGLGGGRRGQQYTNEERADAKLPLPPEQDSQVQALLRPGLLADVEIIVEKIPDALHVPAQSIFTKGGKPTVFVLLPNGKFEPREVQVLKRSESTMVLSGGVKPNEVVAMMDPTADKTAKKGKSDSPGSSPAASMPGGK